MKDRRAEKRRYDVFKSILATFLFGSLSFLEANFNALKNKWIAGEKNLHFKALTHCVESLTFCEYAKNWWCGWRPSGSKKIQPYFPYSLNQRGHHIFSPFIDFHGLYWIHSSNTQSKKMLAHNKNSSYCNSMRQDERAPMRSSMDRKYGQEFSEQIHIVSN